MAGAIPTDAAQILSGARSDALKSLKEALPGYTPMSGAKQPTLARPEQTSISVSGLPTSIEAPPPPPDADMAENGAEGGPVLMNKSDETPPPPPTPEQAAVKPTFFKGSGKEIENGVMHGFASLGRAVAMTSYGAGSAMVDSAHSMLSGKPETGAQDAVFGAIDKYASDAMKYWTPEGESGMGAKALGAAAGVVPALTTGAGALPLLTAQSATDAGMDAIDQGQDAKTAAILATVAATSNALGMKIPLKNPSIWKRIGSSILGNELISTGTQALTKEILDSRGFKEASDNIHPGDPQSMLDTLLIAIGFGLHRQAGSTPKDANAQAQNGSKVGAPPPPDPKTTAPVPPGPPPGPSGTGEAPPPPTPAQAAAPNPAPPTGQPNGNTPAAGAAQVPDKPTAEPSKDLRAQFIDMNDKATPRTGVFLSTDNLSSLNASADANGRAVQNMLALARGQGRVIDTGNGALVAKSKKAADVARERLKTEDPQAVIGSYTGAGAGKEPGQTVVVQGHTPTGAVATESMVKPNEVAHAVAQVEAQGKKPVITTPEEAVQKRIEGISTERNSPTQMGIFTAKNGEQRAVHVEEGAAEGQIRVRPLDENGEPGEHTIDVPADTVKVSQPDEPKAPPPSEPAAVGQEPASKKPEARDVVSPPPDAALGTSQPHPIAGTEDTGRTERRKDESKRKKVSEMSSEEREKALLTNNKSGIPNDRAYEDSEKKKVQVSVDLNSLKTVNDTDGHEAGDAMIKRTAEVLHEESKGNAYHLSGDEYAVQADTHEEAQDIINRAKSRLAEENIGISHGMGEDLKSADKNMNAEKTRQEQAGERAKRGEARPELRPGKQKPKAAAVKTALDALPEALETHQSQEEIPDGKKFAASLGERQDNAASFGAILREAAKAAHGKVADEVVDRASKAAKAAESFAVKGKEATDKGQGTGHTKITAVVAEMHKAARELMGKGKEGDKEIVSPKVVELKAKMAKRAVPKEAPKLKASVKSEAKIEVPVNPKYEHEIVREEKQPAPVIKKQAERLMQEYVNADQTEAKQVREKIEQWLHENMSDTYTPDEMHKVLQLLDGQREERNPKARATRMSDTLEDDDVQYDPKVTEGFSRTSRPSLADKLEQIRNTVFSNRMKGEWDKLAKNFVDKEGIDFLNSKRDTGDHIGSHQLLGKMIEHADTPILKQMLTQLRANMPDLPVYAVSDVKSLRTGESYRGEATNGLFDPTTKTIQVAKGSPSVVMRTIAHEMVHAATSFEINRDKNGPLGRALENARQVLIGRLQAKHGVDVIQAHQDYFADQTKPLPENYQRHLYGIANVHEMTAELFSNPEFQREIADSELFAQPGEKFAVNMKATLLQRIFNAIGRFLGVSDPKLLEQIAGLTEHAMTRQAKNFDFVHEGKAEDFARRFEQTMIDHFGVNPLDAREAMPSFASLREEAPRLRGVDDALRSLTDDETTKMSRAFDWATKNRATDAIRTVVTRLKTQDQLFRDHRRDFGPSDDASNPLRELEEVDIHKNVLLHRMGEVTRPVAEKWLKLKSEENKPLGQLMIDTTMYKLDPRTDYNSQTPEGKSGKGSQARHAEFVKRFEKLSPLAREVYSEAVSANKGLARELRRAGVDAALQSYDAKLTPAQRALLYGAKTHQTYDDLIGKGKLIDVGDGNDNLRNSLKDFAGLSEIDGPYLHLGRQGEYVVSAVPEGTREFADKGLAEDFAQRVNDLSPGSKAKTEFRGGKHVVDYKAQYVSMHETRKDAEAAAREMTKAGFNVGTVTRKTMSKEHTPVSAGMRDLVAEAERKINRDGADAGTAALVDSLRSAFLQMTAARSAYAGSRLARKNFAGVKAEDMRRNFAEHAQSTAWHASQLRTVFQQAAALAKVRGMARDSQGGADQKTMYRRGEVVSTLNAHLQDEVQNYGHKAPLNALLAKLGFMSYLASPSHAFIWMTQNFTTGIPVAGARWGYGKSTVAFAKAMKTVTAPAFRSTIHAVFRKGGTASDVHEAIIKAVKADKHMGKWATGPNSPLQQLIDRGVISHSYSNELGDLAKGDSAPVAKAFEWARLLPNMADAFNRVSTALAALEATGGDVRKAADFTQEVHANYAQQNKPLYFKKMGRAPGMNSVTMFKTYVQAMAHLLYGNVKEAITGEGGKRGEAAKTVAGLVASHALFAGVYKAAALEPLRLALYAYHKLFDDEGEEYDLQNQIHQFLVNHFGKDAGNVAAYGLPRLLGFDLSSRMGLSDLFLHNPPDLLSADKTAWKDFVFDQAGPMASMLADNVSGFTKHWQKGETFQAISSVIPIKMWHDAVKAHELYSTGKQNSLGGSMTEASTLDAAYQLFGLKPASVAEAQEKAGYAVNTNMGIKSARESIIKDYVSSDDKSSAQDRIDTFNSNHPYEAIRPVDLIKMMRFKTMNEQGIQRDPDIAEATDY